MDNSESEAIKDRSYWLEPAADNQETIGNKSIVVHFQVSTFDGEEKSIQMDLNLN